VLALCLLGVTPAAVADVPPGAVATVDGTTISRATFDRWLLPAARADGPRATVPRAGTRRWRRVRTRVMTFLLNARWVALEARERGIRVSRRMVRRQLEDDIRGSFPNRREFHRWRREAGLTYAQLLFRTRDNMLATRMRFQAMGGSEDPEEQERLLEEHAEALRAKWRARTECAPRFLVPECGNAPAT
jgi:hypothetical protein